MSEGNEVCPNCLGEKGFWVDRKDPANSTYLMDNDEDEFQECSACRGTGTQIVGFLEVGQ